MNDDLKWYAIGDLNAFFALFLDNIINLVILAGILIYGFQFPKEIILTKMIPGTALGVMVGDIIYTIMAIRIQKETGKPVTAMPLGLDTPSTVGIALVVLGPIFMLFKNEFGVAAASGAEQVALIEKAGLWTWYIGTALLIWMGLIKLVFSFLGEFIQRIVPTAGLLGSLAGIGMVWLAADSFIKTFHEPLVGMLSLGIVILTLLTQIKLPGNLPGAFIAVFMGTAMYYILHFTGYHVIGASQLPSLEDFRLSLPVFNIDALKQMGNSKTLDYLPIALPFGLLTIIGGINICVAARMAGDNFSTRKILLTESFATFIAGIFGGVSQSTPYIGHGAYKAMGARSGYTLATGLLIGIGGYLGLISFIVNLIPEASVAPLLIFVGFEITVAAFQSIPSKYMLATTLAIIPSVISFGYVKAKTVVVDGQNYLANKVMSEIAKNETFIQAGDKFKLELEQILNSPVISSGFLIGSYPYVESLAQGFIITAMIWGAVVSFLIDREFLKAIYTLIITAVLTFFGVTHSATNSGEVYIPWGKFSDNFFHSIPFQFSVGYLMIAAMITLIYILDKNGTLKQEPFRIHHSEEFGSLGEDSLKD